MSKKRIREESDEAYERLVSIIEAKEKTPYGEIKKIVRTIKKTTGNADARRD